MVLVLGWAVYHLKDTLYHHMLSSNKFSIEYSILGVE